MGASARTRLTMHQKLDGAIPFVWTKTADEILKKANRQTTSNAGH